MCLQAGRRRWKRRENPGTARAAKQRGAVDSDDAGNLPRRASPPVGSRTAGQLLRRRGRHGVQGSGVGLRVGATVTCRRAELFSVGSRVAELVRSPVMVAGCASTGSGGSGRPSLDLIALPRGHTTSCGCGQVVRTVAFGRWSARVAPLTIITAIVCRPSPVGLVSLMLSAVVAGVTRAWVRYELAELGRRGFCTNCVEAVEIPIGSGEWTRTELLRRRSRTGGP